MPIIEPEHNKPLPCPFCGYKADVLGKSEKDIKETYASNTYPFKEFTRDTVWIECSHCEARTRVFVTHNGFNMTQKIIDALNHWNNRKEPKDVSNESP